MRKGGNLVCSACILGVACCIRRYIVFHKVKGCQMVGMGTFGLDDRCNMW